MIDVFILIFISFLCRIPDNKPLSEPVSLGTTDTLKIDLVAREGRSPKRPHQAFLLLKDPTTGLDISYPFSVKSNGKSRVELVSICRRKTRHLYLRVWSQEADRTVAWLQTQKDLPSQLITAPTPLDASFVIGSFGSSAAYNGAAFKLSIGHEADVPFPSTVAQRYGKLPEIHHTFKPNPGSPPVFITLVFVAIAILVPSAALIGLVSCLPTQNRLKVDSDLKLLQWTSIGANAEHLPVALKSAPVPHVVFIGSLVGLEGIFFLYYTSWNLFQTLPPALAVGAVAFISGSRALGEVQGRRLAGLR